uniref:Uncharacterized protein n=1 Tax=Opuntia streptacantha TaxID=393608 RepID=A0A7C9ANF7_OPUST
MLSGQHETKFMLRPTAPTNSAPLSENIFDLSHCPGSVLLEVYIIPALLLQSSTTTLSGRRARTTRSTWRAEARSIWVVPSNQISSGSTNPARHLGTGPNCSFWIRIKQPMSTKSRSSG